MKQFNLTLLTLLMALLCGTVSARGETETDYTVDFNTKIDVSNHNFKVAPNWGHIVDSYYDEDEWETLYVTYSWGNNYGETDGALSVGTQSLSSGYGTGTPVYDLLVTPVVNGTISFKVKTKSSNSSDLTLYSLNETGTAKVDQLKKFTASELGGQVAGLQLLMM